MYVKVCDIITSEKSTVPQELSALISLLQLMDHLVNDFHTTKNILHNIFCMWLIQVKTDPLISGNNKCLTSRLYHLLLACVAGYWMFLSAC